MHWMLFVATSLQTWYDNNVHNISFPSELTMMQVIIIVEKALGYTTERLLFVRGFNTPARSA